MYVLFLKLQEGIFNFIKIFTQYLYYQKTTTFWLKLHEFLFNFKF